MSSTDAPCPARLQSRPACRQVAIGSCANKGGAGTFLGGGRGAAGAGAEHVRRERSGAERAPTLPSPAAGGAERGASAFPTCPLGDGGGPALRGVPLPLASAPQWGRATGAAARPGSAARTLTCKPRLQPHFCWGRRGHSFPCASLTPVPIARLGDTGRVPGYRLLPSARAALWTCPATQCRRSLPHRPCQREPSPLAATATGISLSSLH